MLGCRGQSGNGCSASLVCTSHDSAEGTCVACLADSDCGGTQSGVVCDTSLHVCQAGCRASAGNGCALSLVCTSPDSSIG